MGVAFVTEGVGLGEDAAGPEGDELPLGAGGGGGGHPVEVARRGSAENACSVFSRHGGGQLDERGAAEVNGTGGGAGRLGAAVGHDGDEGGSGGLRAASATATTGASGGTRCAASCGASTGLGEASEAAATGGSESGGWKMAVEGFAGFDEGLTRDKGLTGMVVVNRVTGGILGGAVAEADLDADAVGGCEQGDELVVIGEGSLADFDSGDGAVVENLDLSGEFGGGCRGGHVQANPGEVGGGWFREGGGGEGGDGIDFDPGGARCGRGLILGERGGGDGWIAIRSGAVA